MREFDRRTAGDTEHDAIGRLHDLRRALREAGPGAPPDLDGQLARIVPAFPLKVQIQTTTRCNAACTMCPYPEITGEDGFQHEQMPEPLYRLILHQLRGRGVQRLSLFLMNEPLLDRRMPAWVALAREALPGTTLGLFTNGSPLTATLARRLAEAGLDELCVSVHGFDRRTYEEVMQGLSFDRLQRNLAEVLALSKAGGLGRLHLQLVTGDLPDLRQSLEGADPLIREHVLLKAFSNEREVARVAPGLPSSEGAAAPPEAPPLCQRPFVKLYVLASGECVLCNCDWRRTVVLGRIAPGGPTIEEIWRGAAYLAIRRHQAEGRFPRGLICDGCDYPQVADHE